MRKHEEELTALAEERAKNEQKARAGYVVAPDGSWVPWAVWKHHIAVLRRRAEQSPEHAP